MHKKLAGIAERKRRAGKRKRKWEDNIKNGLEVKGWESVDWIHLVQDRRT
jgi:hypothetical protein